MGKHQPLAKLAGQVGLRPRSGGAHKFSVILNQRYVLKSGYGNSEWEFAGR